MSDGLGGFVPYEKGPTSTTTKTNGKIKNKFTGKSGAYVVDVKVSGKLYVGSSANLAKRINYNLSTLKNNKHHNSELQAAYNDDPDIDVLVCITDTVEEAKQLEQEMVDTFLPFGNLCNEGIDDVTNPAVGLVRSEEFKQKISAVVKERLVTDKGKADLARRIEESKQPVIIDGVTYPSMKEAAKALGVHATTITNRCNSDKYPGYSKQDKNI